jgi:hypothetical protein
VGDSDRCRSGRSDDEVTDTGTVDVDRRRVPLGEGRVSSGEGRVPVPVAVTVSYAADCEREWGCDCCPWHCPWHCPWLPPCSGEASAGNEVNGDAEGGCC